MKKQHQNHNPMRKPKSVFLVSASKGDGDSHSYTIGIYSTLGLAVDSSYIEEDSRGGKYRCSIREIVLNEWVSPSYVSYRVY
jgi:hypothetical protein